MITALKSDDFDMKTNLTRLLSLAYLANAGALPTAYDPGAGWKKNADGTLATDEKGNPIYVNSAGAELSVGGDTISTTQREAQRNRERYEAAEAKLAEFKDIDPAKAKDALDKLTRINQKDLIDKGEIDRVRNEISAQFQSQITERDGKIEELTGNIRTMRVQNAFSGSNFVKDKLAIPADIAQEFFGKRFKDENGELVAYTPNGDKVLSKKNMGKYADFDEALEIFVESYANKDAILKGGNQSGSGSNGGGGGTNGVRTYRRAEFDQLPPAKQHEVAIAAGKGEAQLVD